MLEKVLKEELFLLDSNFMSKEELFVDVAKRLEANGWISNKHIFVQSLFQREDEASTALESNVAIPHAKSSVINEISVAFYRLKTPLIWDSEQTKIDVLFILSIPESSKGSPHIELLSQIATILMNDTFVDQVKKVSTFNQLITLVSNALEAEKTKGKVDKIINNQQPSIVAVTACSTGIAHTYMAAEALQKAGLDLGLTVYVEKQGASGLEDKLSSTQIMEAKAVLLATDVALQEADRFINKPYIQVKVAEAIKSRDAKALLTKLVNNNNLNTYKSMSSDSGKETSSTKNKNEIGDVKYLTHSNPLIALIAHMDKFGSLIFRFLYPIFSMFVAFSLANRLGLVAGFLGGIFASGLHYTLYGISGIPSGFMGAAILGLLAGYSARFFNEKINLPQNLRAIKPMLIVPALSVLVVFLANLYIVDPVMGGFNTWLKEIILSMQQSGNLALASVIAGATAFDLGGPVNKAAGAIAIGLATDKIYPLTARVLSIIIPPIGLGLATVLDRFFVGKRVFSAELRIAGQTSLLLGFLAIGEGGLPFLFANPIITIVINILGAILGSLTAISLGAVQWYPLPAVWGWPLVENLPAYLVGVFVGVAFIALSNIFIRFILLKKDNIEK